MIALSRSGAAQTCAVRIAAARPPITPGEVLGRLKAAFALDDWTGPAGLEDSFASPTVVAQRPDGRFASVCSFGQEGFSARPIPGHNRRSHGPLADPSKRCDPVLDAAATRMICEHDDPITGETFDLDDLVERCRRKTLTRIRAEPGFWAQLCEARQRIPVIAHDRNEEARAQEALDWIVEVEDDCDLERVRQIVLCWLRSKKPQRAFAVLKGIHRNELRRLIETYCAALASRLNAAPNRAAIRRANNDHMRRGATALRSKSLVWQPAVTTDVRAYSSGEAVVKGVAAIAQVTGRKTTSALRLIEGGKAPIAMLDGQPCAIRELLDIEKYRSKAKPAHVRESLSRLKSGLLAA